MGLTQHMYILIVISLGIGRQLSEFLWAIADVSFVEASASICFSYNNVYVRVQV